MKEYIWGIVGAILLASVVALVAPSGKMGGMMKGVCRIFCFIAILSPLGGLLSGELALPDSRIAVDEGYIAACKDLSEKSVEREVGYYLSTEFSLKITVAAECESDSPFSVKKIFLTDEETGIIENEEHIVIIGQAVEELKKRYGCEVLVQ